MKKIDRKNLYWIIAAVIVVIACILWLVLGPGRSQAPASEPSESEPQSSVPAPAPSSEPEESSTPPKREPTLIDQTRELTIADLPADITPASTEEELIRYIVIRGGHNLFTGLAYPLFESFTAAELDKVNQEYLFYWFLLYTNEYYRTEHSNGDYLVPSQRSIQDGWKERFVFRKEDVSAVFKEVFGIDDYIIRCPFYDEATGQYTFDHTGIGGIEPGCLIENFVWDGTDRLTFDIYSLDPKDRETVKETNWVRMHHVTMTRVNGKMVFTASEFAENPNWKN